MDWWTAFLSFLTIILFYHCHLVYRIEVHIYLLVIELKNSFYSAHEYCYTWDTYESLLFHELWESILKLSRWWLSQSQSIATFGNAQDSDMTYNNIVIIKRSRKESTKYTLSWLHRVLPGSNYRVSSGK